MYPSGRLPVTSLIGKKSLYPSWTVSYERHFWLMSASLYAFSSWKNYPNRMQWRYNFSYNLTTIEKVLIRRIIKGRESKIFDCQWWLITISNQWLFLILNKYSDVTVYEENERVCEICTFRKHIFAIDMYDFGNIVHLLISRSTLSMVRLSAPRWLDSQMLFPALPFDGYSRFLQLRETGQSISM